MKKLIIGGAGFIGSVLVKNFLKEGDDIIVIDNLSLGSSKFIDTTKVDFHQININDIDSVIDILQDKLIDEVWHFAANSNIPAGIDDMNIDLNNTFNATFAFD